MEKPPSNLRPIGKTEVERRKPSRRGFFKKSAGYAGGVAAGSIAPSRVTVTTRAKSLVQLRTAITGELFAMHRRHYPPKDQGEYEPPPDP